MHIPYTRYSYDLDAENIRRIQPNETNVYIKLFHNKGLNSTVVSQVHTYELSLLTETTSLISDAS